MQSNKLKINRAMFYLLNRSLVLVIKYLVAEIHVVLVLIKTSRYSLAVKSWHNPSSAKLLQVLMILNKSTISLACSESIICSSLADLGGSLSICGSIFGLDAWNYQATHPSAYYHVTFITKPHCAWGMTSTRKFKKAWTIWDGPRACTCSYCLFTCSGKWWYTFPHPHIIYP